MNKLLVICGPTATGKTALALHLAQKFGGELISADSRQVYRGLDIGTGKDIPTNFKFQISNFKLNQKKIGYYTDGKTKIWGVDLVDPNEDFSVADFVRFTIPVVESIWRKQKLPIIVGGTGLYIRSLVQFLPDIFHTRDPKLRAQLETSSVEELQKEMKQKSPHRWQKMNHSDQNNPRRLVRALEIVQTQTESLQKKSELKKYQQFTLTVDPLVFGLTVPKEILEQRIYARIKKRMKQGELEELKKLLRNGYSWDLPAMSATGYRVWKAYFEKKTSLEKIITAWEIEERNYAKRQITWFKKEAYVRWYEATSSTLQSIIQSVVKVWLSKDLA